MTRDMEQLYAAICENYRENTPRLMYADALDEIGEHEHARYIRLAIELENPPDEANMTSVVEWKNKLEETEKIIGNDYNYTRWTERFRNNDYSPTERNIQFCRGFPNSIQCTVIELFGGTFLREEPTLAWLGHLLVKQEPFSGIYLNIGPQRIAIPTFRSKETPARWNELTIENSRRIDVLPRGSYLPTWLFQEIWDISDFKNRHDEKIYRFGYAPDMRYLAMRYLAYPTYKEGRDIQATALCNWIRKKVYVDDYISLARP